MTPPRRPASRIRWGQSGSPTWVASMSQRSCDSYALCAANPASTNRAVEPLSSRSVRAPCKRSSASSSAISRASRLPSHIARTRPGALPATRVPSRNDPAASPSASSPPAAPVIASVSASR